MAIVLGVKIFGIILITALLVIPPATSRLLTHSFRSFFVTTMIISEVIVSVGLLLSFYWDLPSGATIVLTGTALFFLATLLTRRT